MAESHLEELRKRLYKKGESFEKRMRRPELTPHPEKVRPFWEESINSFLPTRKTFFTTKKLILVVVILLVLGAVGIGIFYFFGGPQVVSSRNIEFKILGPETLDGGEKTSWEVLVVNRNRQALESAELIFEYPPGAEVADLGVKGPRARKSLGTLEPGEEIRISFTAFLFGSEGEDRTVHASLEYRPRDSSAILFKEAQFSTRITRSPVGLSIDIPREIRSGQDVEFSINYVSNSESELEDLFLELDSPAGFTFITSTPGSEDKGKLWRIGALKPHEKGSIKVRGSITGGDLEEKSFKIQAGTRSPSGELNIYGRVVGAVILSRPFLDIEATAKGQKIYVARPGDNIEVKLAFRNNLPVPVQNVIVEAIFGGTGLDENEIRSPQGTYRPASRSVVWNASSAEILKKLDPGQEGVFQLYFSFMDPIPIRTSSDKNFKIEAEIKISPGIFPPGFQGTDITGSDKVEAKLASRLQLVRRGFYFSNLIPNFGPLPPKVGVETTYTVVWSLTNATNDVGGLTARAVLPPYINWKGVISPRDGALSYEPSTGEVLWRIGEIKAGTGFLRPAKEVAFQIGLVPGVNHIGDTPRLVSNVRIEGRDLFTDSSISAEAPALSSELRDDPRVDTSQGRVLP